MLHFESEWSLDVEFFEEVVFELKNFIQETQLIFLENFCKKIFDFFFW